MIIAQYGKRKICNLLKNGYYIISRSVVPCQILRISSQLLRWVYCAINRAKEELPTMRPLGIGKHPHTHSKQPILELSLCFVCV